VQVLLAAGSKVHAPALLRAQRPPLGATRLRANSVHPTCPLAARTSAAQRTVVPPLMTRWDTCTPTDSASIGCPNPNLQGACARVGVRTATARLCPATSRTVPCTIPPPHVPYLLLPVPASSMYPSVPRRPRLPLHNFRLVFSLRKHAALMQRTPAAALAG